jgi:hypothetical protein
MTDLASRIRDARANALQPRIGTLLEGTFLVTGKEAAAIYIENQDRAEAYVRWRHAEYEAGNVTTP